MSMNLDDLCKCQPSTDADVAAHEVWQAMVSERADAVAAAILQVLEQREAKAGDSRAYDKFTAQLGDLRGIEERITNLGSVAEKAVTAARGAERARKVAAEKQQHQKDCAGVHAAAVDVDARMRDLRDAIRVLLERQQTALSSAGPQRFTLRALFDRAAERFPSSMLATFRPLDFYGVQAIGHLSFPWKAGETCESLSFAYAFRRFALDEQPPKEAA